MPSTDHPDAFFHEHASLTRRWFLYLGAAGVATLAGRPADAAAPPSSALAALLDKLEPYFTPPAQFRDVSRGNPVPHSLTEAKKREVGLTRDTWTLEVISDPENPAKLDRQLTKKDGTALDFKALLKLGEKHAVRFAKVMTCLNIGCPLGMGIWEGVPLREVVWMTGPRENLRRVMYHGYHNDDPKQLFRGSLPVGRVLEDPFDLPPVILCYKLNGEWLNGHRGGPVRLIVPEAYGFKSVKWLTHVVLTNLAHSNDTYAGGNNDIDSPLKSFAATLQLSRDVKTGEPIAATGYAQVGISGLSNVQVWLHAADRPWPADDADFTKAPWVNAKILPPPERWGGGVAEIPKNTLGFAADTGQPKTWPMRLGKAHWAVLLPGVPAGEYVFRCRTVDEKGQAQPMPRPFKKSGHAAIETVKLTVKP